MTAANFAILDTSVYIDNLRSGRFKQEILDLKFVIRCSAFVRELHFHVLIALTARRIGAYLITCNVDDFTAAREYLAFNLVCW